MIKNRILSTLKFFDLQDYPLTLLEIHKFLMADLETIKKNLDNQGEIVGTDFSDKTTIGVEEILACLDNECQTEIQNHVGFYYLSGRSKIVEPRLRNYFFGIEREKLIKKYARGLKYLPFVRGAALAGSQAMGQQKESSDIDLLIITDPKFMWLARTLVTAYFQILGKRRYGAKIANRFCLNHYLAGPKSINRLKNLYTASEYLKLRTLVGEDEVLKFQAQNLEWIKLFFPNAEIKTSSAQPNKAQAVLEKIFHAKFCQWLEQKLKNWQLPRIRQEKFILVEEDELSFHPESKQQFLLQMFFKKNLS